MNSIPNLSISMVDSERVIRQRLINVHKIERNDLWFSNPIGPICELILTVRECEVKRERSKINAVDHKSRGDDVTANTNTVIADKCQWSHGHNSTPHDRVNKYHHLQMWSIDRALLEFVGAIFNERSSFVKIFINNNN